MRVQGRVFADGAFWLAEVPILDAMAQGHSEQEAVAMVRDLVETLANRPGFAVTVHPCGNGDIEIGANDARGLISLILRRQRARSGLSVAEAARRIGAKSPDAWARYERGAASPTLDKLSEMMAAVAGSDFVLQRGAAP